jgi:hypothetical protein
MVGRVAPRLGLMSALLCGAALALTGCGGEQEKLSPVEGKVLLGDKALTTGFVTFYPDATKGNTSKEEPRADIGPDGSYVVSTGNRKGAAPGWYRVAVTAADQIDPKNPYFTKWLIPQRYIDPSTSKLAVQVVQKPGPNAYDLKLQPQ